MPRKGAPSHNLITGYRRAGPFIIAALEDRIRTMNSKGNVRAYYPAGASQKARAVVLDAARVTFMAAQALNATLRRRLLSGGCAGDNDTIRFEDVQGRCDA